jgi:hypothetical protein
MAPAQGPPGEDKFVTISLKKGEKLGENVAHYRDARWFKDVDLMLQEEGLVRESAPDPLPLDNVSFILPVSFRLIAQSFLSCPLEQQFVLTILSLPLGHPLVPVSFPFRLGTSFLRFLSSR